jgi:hypothetical protein
LVEKGELPEIWSEEVERLGVQSRVHGGVSVEERRRERGVPLLHLVAWPPRFP